MAARHKSVETKYMEERDRVLRGLRGLDRRSFLKVLAPRWAPSWPRA